MVQPAGGMAALSKKSTEFTQECRCLLTGSRKRQESQNLGNRENLLKLQQPRCHLYLEQIHHHKVRYDYM